MSLEKPILSVIVVSYNHKEYIEKCLDSILMQRTEYPFEILLADDCSPDKTAQVVAQKYGEQVKILERKKNLGLCKNMYDAYMQANGKYIFISSGDDYLPVETVFDKQVRYLEEHEDIFSVTGWHELYLVSENTKKVVQAPYEEYTLLDFLRGKRVCFNEGTMRNTFRADHPEYLCKASKDNEEIQMLYYLFSKGKKVILPEVQYTYCYRNTENASNYNSTHSYLDMLRDYVQGFRAVEKIDQKKHNFSMIKVAHYGGCIDYHIQNNGLKGIFPVLRILGVKDSLGFAWIKLLIKLNHRKIPEFLLSEKRLIRSR